MLSPRRFADDAARRTPNDQYRKAAMKLLIVEDNPAVRLMMRRVLADLADDICECSDGAEALEAYRAAQPDWVLMDIRMPRVNGLTATRQITSYDPAARVVIVTNHNEAELRAAATAAGACGYVLKENLLEVRRWLQASLKKHSG